MFRVFLVLALFSMTVWAAEVFGLSGIENGDMESSGSWVYSGPSSRYTNPAAEKAFREGIKDPYYLHRIKQK